MFFLKWVQKTFMEHDNGPELLAVDFLTVFFFGMAACHAIKNLTPGQEQFLTVTLAVGGILWLLKKWKQGRGN